MMSDAGRDGYGQPEEDRLPWLEPVDEVPVEEGVSAGRLIAGLVVALIALGLVVGGVYWLKQRSGGTGATQVASTDGTTIPAPGDPYKVKPAEPGGMQVKGQGDSSYAASEGADVNGQIDLSAAPEAPIAKPVDKTPPAPAAAAPAPAPTAPVPAPKPVAVAKAPTPAPVPAKPAAAPTGGAQVQLGAFDSEAKANSAWKAMSGRFSVLSGLSPSVTSVQVNGRTFYRLRASAGGQASAICSKLKVAGEACAVIGG